MGLPLQKTLLRLTAPHGSFAARSDKCNAHATTAKNLIHKLF
jgi:hypothetical protein